MSLAHRAPVENLVPAVPEECLATWVATLREFEQSVDGDEAGRRFQFNSGYLQALWEGKVIDQSTHAAMRQQLLAVWHALGERLDG